MALRINEPATRYETVIAGAGPAGIMCALKAAERGPVLIVDSSPLPRDKSCGGMLNEWSQEFLASLGEIPESLVLDPRYVHFRFHDWDRKIRRPTELRFLNVDRAGFDDWLISLLPDNVEVLGRAPVIGFEQDAESVRVKIKLESAEKSVECSTLVGADGARSAVRRQLGIGTVANYITLQDFCRIEGNVEPFFDCLYLRDIGDSFGYGYVVPKGDVAIVGGVFYPKTKRPHERQEQLLAILREKLPLGESTKREACVALSVRSRDDVVCGVGRVLLTGEAAGFMSPTSGEGISYALNSGLLAGQAVASTSGNGATLASYHKSTAALRSNISRKLRWLPFMESSWGKYMAGFVPQPIVSKVTRGL